MEFHSINSPSRPRAQGPGKKWEHYPLNDNGKVERVAMHIRAGDLVKVIAGSDKGTIGKITKVNAKTGQVIVEGVNIKTKHVKPKAQGETGQIMKMEFPVHHSNVQLYSEKEGVVSRAGMKVLGDGSKVRFLKKTGEVLESPKPALKE